MCSFSVFGLDPVNSFPCLQKAFEIRRLKMSTIRAEQTKSELMRRNRGDDLESKQMNREVWMCARSGLPNDRRILQTSEFNFAKLQGAGSHENELVDCLLEHKFITPKAGTACARARHVGVVQRTPFLAGSPPASA
jgi:hypothetical protein